ncbi:MAG TPA: glycosyltransferase family 2 protein [Candidatus Moranbacteria bacterium]|nr:glycosyltransferase family 2 protein [Candidatus Moranbacteria bacterium]
MSEKPELTIAVNGYRNPEMLKLCLESIFSTLRDKNIDYELIVADSATEAETYDLMRQEFPQVTFLPDERNIGFGAMVNKCLSVARGEYVFLINSDTILEDRTVVDLLAYIKSHPDVGIVAPAQKSFNGRLANTCFRFYKPMTVFYRRTFLGKLPFARRHLAEFEMKDYDRREPKEVDWVIGSAMMVRRSDVEKIGMMDRRFFMYMEDVDWCRRFWKAGRKVVFLPTVTMYHYYGKGSAKGGVLRALLLNKLTRIHIASAIKYFWKYRGEELPHR